jgi:hypothetical protein
MDSKYKLIFCLALAAVELLAILQFFTKYKFRKISEKDAATWWQESAAMITAKCVSTRVESFKLFTTVIYHCL